MDKQNSLANNERALEILHAQGVRVTASFIVDPKSDSGEFSRLRAYVRQRRIRQPSFTVLTPLPGTQLFDQYRQRLTTANYELFDLLHAVLPTRMALPDFYREFARLYRSAYMGQLASWARTPAATWRTMACLASSCQVIGWVPRMPRLQTARVRRIAHDHQEHCLTVSFQRRCGSAGLSDRLLRQERVRRILMQQIERRLLRKLEEETRGSPRPRQVEEDKRDILIDLIHSIERGLRSGVIAPGVSRNLLRNLVFNVILRSGQEESEACLRFATEHEGYGPPSLLVLSPGKSCNLRCTGCYANAGLLSEKLDWETFDRVFEQVREHADSILVITVSFNYRDLYAVEFTPVMGTHSGPGVVRLAYCLAEK